MQRNYSPPPLSAHPGRRGFTTPAVAIGLLVLMLAFALILDRIWLETAQLELRNAAEAAALAGAAKLANDDLLRSDVTEETHAEQAREAAAEIAAENFVGGQSVMLNTEPDGDVRIGVLESDSYGTRFRETDSNATTVVVTASRTRSLNNPVALFVSGVTSLPFGDVVVRTEASIGNDLLGLRPIKGTPVPALPIAILKLDPSEQRSDTWDNLIEKRQGADDYSFDEQSHTVVNQPDGIPEMILRSMRVGQDPGKANVLLLDLGTGINDSEVTRQFEKGLTTKDLKSHDGQLIVGHGASLDLTATPDFDGAQLSALQKLVGECRICLLYSQSVPQRQPPDVTATCDTIVAIRILDVSGTNSGACDITIQPTVMTTRTALLASEQGASAIRKSDGSFEDELSGSSKTSSSSAPAAGPNTYVYKLSLTY